MDESVSWVFWLIVIAPPLVWSASQSLCWVPGGHVGVVTRRGRVVRVRGAGLTLRIPALEQCVSVPEKAVDVSVLVRARTADDRSALVLLAVTTRSVAHTPGRRFHDPRQVAAAAVERHTLAELALLDTAMLPDTLEDRMARLRRLADDETVHAGVEVLGVRLIELDLVLAATADHARASA